MKVKYNQSVDILSIRLTDEAVEESDEAQLGLVIDYDAAGTMVGFEIMDASKKMSQPTTVQLEVA